MRPERALGVGYGAWGLVTAFAFVLNLSANSPVGFLAAQAALAALFLAAGAALLLSRPGRWLLAAAALGAETVHILPRIASSPTPADVVVLAVLGAAAAVTYREGMSTRR